MGRIKKDKSQRKKPVTIHAYLTPAEIQGIDPVLLAQIKQEVTEQLKNRLIQGY